MFTFIKHQKEKFLFLTISRAMVFVMSFALVFAPSAGYAQGIHLPAPGTMVLASPAFNPAIIKGMTIHPQDPFLFDFIIHPGDNNLQGQEFEDESIKLIKYFMAALTVPEDEMWVNLSPYEKNRIIPNGFGDTEMGRDLLAQDYILKQLTASLMYPEDELGNEFWNRVYKRAYEEFGTREVPMNTFNKVWIVPEKAAIYENGPNIFVVESRFKVMLEEDYLALEANSGSTKHGLGNVSKGDLTKLSEVSSKVIREIIIPEIEKEVNEGKTFANLRQISNSVILANWYKQNIKQSLLKQVYVNQNKTDGIDTKDKEINQKIYEQYVEAFKKGVYDFIKEEYDPTTRELTPRKYFSGGVNVGETSFVASQSPGVDFLDETQGFRTRLSSSSSPISLPSVKDSYPQLFEPLNDQIALMQDTMNLVPSMTHAKGVIGLMLAMPIDERSGLMFEELAKKRLLEVAGRVYDGETSIEKEYGPLVRAHSGSSVNTITDWAMLKPGEIVSGLELAKGGHLTHGHPGSVSAVYYKSKQYGLGEGGKIDYTELEAFVEKEKPKKLVIGGTAYPERHDYKRLAHIAHSNGAELHVDAAHDLTLIAVGELNSPFGHADVITFTTQKSPDGPRHGAGLFRYKSHFDRPLYADAKKAEEHAIQEGPNWRAVAAKAVQFGLMLKNDFKEYGEGIRLLMEAMVEAGHEVGWEFSIPDGSKTHLGLLNTFKRYGIKGKQAQEILETLGLGESVFVGANANTVPVKKQKIADLEEDVDVANGKLLRGDRQTPFGPDGIRMGVPSLVKRGVPVEKVKELVEMIHRILDEVTVDRVVKRVSRSIRGTKKMVDVVHWENLRLDPEIAREAQEFMKQLTQNHPVPDIDLYEKALNGNIEGMFKSLLKEDPKVAALLIEGLEEQTNRLNVGSTKNEMRDETRLILSHPSEQVYSEGVPDPRKLGDKRYYPMQPFIDRVELLAMAEAVRLFGLPLYELDDLYKSSRDVKNGAEVTYEEIVIIRGTEYKDLMRLGFDNVKEIQKATGLKIGRVKQIQGEAMAAASQSKTFGVNVQPHAHSQGISIGLQAAADPNDKVLELHTQSSHYSSRGADGVGSFVNRYYDFRSKKVGKNNEKDLRIALGLHKAKVVIYDPTQFNSKELRKIVDEEIGEETILFADIGKATMTMMLEPENSVFTQADLITLDTESAGGPVHSVIYASKSREMKGMTGPEAVQKALIPGQQGGPKNPEIAALADQFRWLRSEDGLKMASELKGKASALFRGLRKSNNQIVVYKDSQGTGVHIDLKNLNITHRMAKKALASIGIDAQDSNLFYYTYGSQELDIGVIPLVMRGLTERNFEELGRIIMDALTSSNTRGFIDGAMEDALIRRVKQLTDLKPLHQELRGELHRIAASSPIVVDNPVKTSVSARNGGIDFNPNIMEIESRGRTEGFVFDFNNQINMDMNINGLIPVIINVTPITNIPLLLGVIKEEEDFELSSLN